MDESKEISDSTRYGAVSPHFSIEPTEAEIEARKQWLDFTKEDEENLHVLNELMGGNVDDLLDFLYDHFLRFDHTRSFFQDKKVLERAKSAQKEYFRRLTQGQYDRDYVFHRLRVGETHYRIGLDTQWYLGAYCRALSFIGDLVRKELSDYEQRAPGIINSLTKLIFFDMGLAIDAYDTAKLNAISEHQDAIRQLETERHVTRSMVENAPVGIVRLGTDFVCVEPNPEFVAMTGHKNSEELIGVSIFDLCTELPRETFEKAVNAASSSRATADFLSMAHASHAFYDWAVWPINDAKGHVSGVVAIFVNVSASVKVQQQREDFVATLTHDLKTPILAANRALKLLADGDFGPVQDTQKNIIDTILQSNDAMYEMVLTLLDVYKYDSGAKQLNIVPVDLVKAIEKMVQELAPLAEQKQIKLTLALPEAGIPVLSDIDEIRRVLQNLIDNSLKFTASGGEITVKVDQGERWTKVFVIDTGKGIKSEDKPKLFQRFWAATSGGRYYASTGLGLYLCHKIVESHRGKIWCDSEPGKGSTFAFSLPNVVLS